MDKIDFKEELKHFYNSSLKVVMVVEVPPLNFLMIDGQGDPTAPEKLKTIIRQSFF